MDAPRTYVGYSELTFCNRYLKKHDLKITTQETLNATTKSLNLTANNITLTPQEKDDAKCVLDRLKLCKF